MNVGVACIDSNTVLFLAGDSSGNYAGVYTDTSIYVEGSFVINSDLTYQLQSVHGRRRAYYCNVMPY